jgi:hypothetical protein
MEEMRNSHKILVRNPEGLERLRRRWKDIIKTVLKETGCKVVGFIGMAQDRVKCWDLANSAMNLRTP